MVRTCIPLSQIAERLGHASHVQRTAFSSYRKTAQHAAACALACETPREEHFRAETMSCPGSYPCPEPTCAGQGCQYASLQYDLHSTSAAAASMRQLHHAVRCGLMTP